MKDVIERLADNLPKSEEKIIKAFQDCLKEKRIQIRERTFVKVPKEEHEAYIDSALRALNAAKVLLDAGNYEWVIVPCYSAIYQAGNAVLIKELEKECRDHFCMLISLLKLKKIGGEQVKDALNIKEKLDVLPEESIRFASKLRLARSSVIYKPSLDFNERFIAERVFEKAKSFVDILLKVL